MFYNSLTNEADLLSAILNWWDIAAHAVIGHTRQSPKRIHDNFIMVKKKQKRIIN